MSSLMEAPTTSGEIAVGTRKERRIVETQEIRIRTTHRRRKVMTRGGVLAGFVLAMVVYPIYGTIAPYADAAEALPGVTKGQSPSTAAALLGAEPLLLSSDLPLPEVDANLLAYTASEAVVVTTGIPNCSPSTPIKGTNGRVAASSLCALPQRGQSLAAEAALGWNAMNSYFRTTFGRNICLDDSYRTLQQQFGTRATRGYLAARPGTSMHGWGLAVDICKEDLRGAKGEWLRANAKTFGWENPYWAKTSKYEPWHWEYFPLTARYYDSSWGSGSSNYSDGGSSKSSSSSSSSSSDKSGSKSGDSGSKTTSTKPPSSGGGGSGGDDSGSTPDEPATDAEG